MLMAMVRSTSSRSSDTARAASYAASGTPVCATRVTLVGT